MATRKRRPVLYEVGRRVREKPGKTVWAWPSFKGRAGASDTETELPAPPTPRITQRTQPAPAPLPQPAPPPIRSRPVESTSEDGGASFRLDALELRLRGGNLLVAVALFMVVLVVTFQGGASYGFHRGQNAPPSLADNSSSEDDIFGTASSELLPPDDDSGGTPLVPSSGQAAAPPPVTKTPPPVELKSGYHYIFIQHFPRSAARDAEKAAQYLTSEGVPCAIRKDKDVVVVATEAFLIEQSNAAAGRGERARADKLLARIRLLGKEYATQGYTFEGAQLRRIR